MIALGSMTLGDNLLLGATPVDSSGFLVGKGRGANKHIAYMTRLLKKSFSKEIRHSDCSARTFRVVGAVLEGC
eukprot:4602233-Amphidinium_carterae.1